MTSKIREAGEKGYNRAHSTLRYTRISKGFFTLKTPLSDDNIRRIFSGDQSVKIRFPMKIQ